ncbi:hypothetical protein E0F15_20610 [Frankia sp. B2]|uniref:type IV secretion system protein n=1 Tax=Frankia sp. B2 TaxID=2541730 RepID=UPI001068F35A|nr:type IV secretion system protein [Frankia sp. B2]TFE25061.1 hypothetical protein E0F15_20610 [Frankia sp. B2]
MPDDGDSKPPVGVDDALFGDDPSCPPSKTPNLQCIPIDHFDIWYDAGGWSAIDTKVTGTLTQWIFALARVTIRVGIWIITYSLQFSLADAFAEPAGRAASAYQSNALLKLGIPLLCLSSSQIWSAFQIARGRLSRGFAEAATSLFISTLATGLLMTPSQTILGEHGLLNTTRDIGLCVAAATTTGCDTATGGDPAAIARPLVAEIKVAFVIEPNEVLNTGQVLAKGNPCLDAYRRAVADGPWNTKGDPRKNYLRKVDGADHDVCDKMADWNEKMTAERLVGALLVELAAILVCVLLIFIGGGLLVAQLVLIALVCLTFFAVAAGQAPGPGRAVFYSWITSCLKAAAAVLIGIVFLSVYLYFLVELLRTTEQQPMIAKFGLLDLLAAASFIFYRRMRRAGERVGRQLGSRMQKFQPGANAPVASWMRPAAAAGGGGGSTSWEMGKDSFAPRPLDVAERALYWRRTLRRSSARSGSTKGTGSAGGAGQRGRQARRSEPVGSANRTARGGLHIGRNVTIHMSAPRATETERVRRAEDVARMRRRRAPRGAGAGSRASTRDFRRSAAGSTPEGRSRTTRPTPFVAGQRQQQRRQHQRRQQRNPTVTDRRLGQPAARQRRSAGTDAAPQWWNRTNRRRSNRSGNGGQS